MRKGFTLFLGILLVLSCGGCNYDLYYGKRPYDYGAARWVCEDISAWFEVDPDAEEYYYPEGEVEIDDQTWHLKLYFVTETKYVSLKTSRSYESGKGSYIGDLDGECEFSPEKLIIKIDKETDTIFHGQLDELVFVRTPID